MFRGLQLPDAASACSAPTQPPCKITAAAENTAACARRHCRSTVSQSSHPDVQSTNHRSSSSSPLEALGRNASPRGADSPTFRVPSGCAETAGGNPDGHRLRFPPPVHSQASEPRAVSPWSWKIAPASDDPMRSSPRISMRFSAPSTSAGDCGRDPFLLCRRAPALRRCRSGEGRCSSRYQLSDVYTTMSTFMGGYLVNYFNRFGRQWQTYVEAEGAPARTVNNINQFYVRSANGSQVPLGLAGEYQKNQRSGVYLSASTSTTPSLGQHRGQAPGFSSGQVMNGAGELTFA